jgi:hypothetical protein
MKPETLTLIYVVGAFALFFIMREILLWYFKINKLIQIKQAELALMAKQYENDGGHLTELEKTEIEKALQK